MRLATIFQYQVGQAKAIEEVAGNSRSIWVGVALALMTAVARNYDQRFILESWLWIFGPLLFSFVSGTLFYFVLKLSLRGDDLRSPEERKESGGWTGFLALFWMTAPVAWLYAIPVERFMDRVAAAKANIALLLIVSVWRVLLLSRVVSVLRGLRFAHAFWWVSLIASVEVLIVSILGSGALRRVMAGMSGMINAPEEDVLYRAANMAFSGALALLVISVFALAMGNFLAEVKSLPKRTRGAIPTRGLVALAIAWAVAAIAPQVEQRRFLAHYKLVEREEYRASIDFLARYQPGDFPAGRRLEPSPYEYYAFDRLPRMVAELKPSDPKWIRDQYLAHLSALFRHRRWSFQRANAVEIHRMFLAVEELPEGKTWARANEKEFEKLALAMASRDANTSEEAAYEAEKGLRATLERLGIDPRVLNLPGEASSETDPK